MLGKTIAKLTEIQRGEGLTDKEMAKRLGCSRQLWQMTRTEKVPLSNTILKCISKNFPELNKDVLNFLSCDGDGLSSNVINNPLKRFLVGLLARIRK